MAQKSPYPKTHNPCTLRSAPKGSENSQKKNALTELLDKKAVEDIIERPDSVTEPWYGQLMKAPQILAYIIELDYWFEKYGVEIVG